MHKALVYALLYVYVCMHTGCYVYLYAYSIYMYISYLVYIFVRSYSVSCK